MHRLYENLKNDTALKKAPSNEELCLAANLPPIDRHESNIIVASLKVSSIGVGITEDELDLAAVVWFIESLTTVQYSHVIKVHNWDQDKFERLLAKWLVTSD